MRESFRQGFFKVTRFPPFCTVFDFPLIVCMAWSLGWMAVIYYYSYSLISNRRTNWFQLLTQRCFHWLHRDRWANEQPITSYLGKGSSRECRKFMWPGEFHMKFTTCEGWSSHIHPRHTSFFFPSLLLRFIWKDGLLTGWSNQSRENKNKGMKLRIWRRKRSLL